MDRTRSEEKAEREEKPPAGVPEGEGERAGDLPEAGSSANAQGAQSAVTKTSSEGPGPRPAMVKLLKDKDKEQIVKMPPRSPALPAVPG